MHLAYPSHLFLKSLSGAPDGLATGQDVVSEVPQPTLEVFGIAVFLQNFSDQQPLPFTDENLSELRRGRNLQSTHLCMWFSRIISPLQITGIDRIYVLRCQKISGSSSLFIAELGQISVRMTKHLSNGISLALTVSYKYNFRVFKTHHITLRGVANFRLKTDLQRTIVQAQSPKSLPGNYTTRQKEMQYKTQKIRQKR